jgi:hypothetical protein
MSWNLPGAPWLIAHKSMLKVNRPQMLQLMGRIMLFGRIK